MEIVEPRQPGFVWRWIEEYFETGNVSREPLGFGKRPAVLVIDLQKGNPAVASHPLVSRAVKNTAHLLKTLAAEKVPVIYTVNAFRDDLKDLPPTKLKGLASCVTGTRFVEIMDEVAPKQGDIVLRKTTHSPFISTHILFHLTRLQADTVIVTGIHTGGCIRATATDAFSYGFRTVVPEECVGDGKGMNPHKANLCDLHIRGADVVSLSEVERYLKKAPA